MTNNVPVIHETNSDDLLPIAMNQFRFGDDFEIIYEKAGMLTLMDYHMHSMLYKIHEPFSKAAKRNGYKLIIKEDLKNRKITYSFSKIRQLECDNKEIPFLDKDKRVICHHT